MVDNRFVFFFWALSLVCEVLCCCILVFFCVGFFCLFLSMIFVPLDMNKSGIMAFGSEKRIV